MFYSLVQITLSGLPSTSFSTNHASLTTFINLLASDIAYALGLPSDQLKFVSAKLLGPSSLQVQFELSGKTAAIVKSNLQQFQGLVAAGSSSLMNGQASGYISSDAPPQDVTSTTPSDSVTISVGAAVGITIACAVVGAVIVGLIVRYICRMKLRRATVTEKAAVNSIPAIDLQTVTIPESPSHVVHVDVVSGDHPHPIPHPGVRMTV